MFLSFKGIVLKISKENQGEEKTKSNKERIKKESANSAYKTSHKVLDNRRINSSVLANKFKIKTVPLSSIFEMNAMDI